MKKPKKFWKNIPLSISLLAILLTACNSHQNNTSDKNTEISETVESIEIKPVAEQNEETLIGYVERKIIELDPLYGKALAYQGLVAKNFLELNGEKNILTIDWKGTDVINGVVTNETGQVIIVTFWYSKDSTDYQGVLEFNLAAVDKNNTLPLQWYSYEGEIVKYDEDGFILLVYDNSILVAKGITTPIDLFDLPKTMIIESEGEFNFEKLTKPRIDIKFLN